MKLAPRPSAVADHGTVEAAAAAAWADSRTRITAKPRASHANPAGSVQRCLCRSRHSPRLILISRRSDGNHVPKAPKGNEETGKAAHEGRTACAEKTR